jgi:hypothetical protein
MVCGTRSSTTTDLKPGTYYLFVDADGNQQKGNFNLTITATAPTAATNDVCPNAAPITINPATLKGSVYGVTNFSNDNYSGTCAGQASGAGAPDLVYSFVIPAGMASVTISANTAVDPAKPWNAVLFSAGSSCGASFISCAPAGASLVLSYPSAGTHYLVLDGKTAADKGEFNLNVQMTAN